MQIYKTENLTYSYPDSEKPALNRINLGISRGEVILFAGNSGCGKTTLLKLLAGLVPAFYGGKISGSAYYKEISILSQLKPLAPQVGMLFQDPEKQLVTSTVEGEIVLPMENIGLKPAQIKERLDKVLGMVGIGNLIDKKICNLSSGQKQKVALASVLGMDPDVLILDEPTSQIDPEASEEILNTVKSLAGENGKTILIAEHKLEKCLPFVSRVIAVDAGRIAFDGRVDEYCRCAQNCGNKTKAGSVPIPLRPSKTAIEIKNLCFSYDEAGDILRNINLTINKGEFTAVVGKNGSGKTTLLKNVNGLLIPKRGSVRIDGSPTKGNSIFELAQKISYLGQNPDDYLFNHTVKDEILFTLNNYKRKWDEETKKLLRLLNLDKVENKNPRDLSTGQKQRTALASVMCMFQNILLLDEPTRGMDYINKKALGELLQTLKNKGAAIVLVTHDMDFAAEYSDRIILMNEGEIIEDGYDLINYRSDSFRAVHL